MICFFCGPEYLESLQWPGPNADTPSNFQVRIRLDAQFVRESPAQNLDFLIWEGRGLATKFDDADYARSYGSHCASGRRVPKRTNR